MAKQIVNTGLADNDGTGDPLRNAFTKVNENFTELYNAETFSGSYADLSNKPISITAFGITDGSNNQILSTDGAGNFTFVNSSASVDLDTELNVASATNNQVLSWTGTEFDWVDNSGAGLSNNAIINLVTSADLDMSGNKVLFGNVYDAEGDLPAAGSYHGMFAHVHGTGKAYYAHAGAWVRLADFSEVGGGGGSSLQTRINKVGTTASLADGATANLDITGFKGYALLSITTDKAAWVRIYSNGATRTADASRLEVTDPTPDAGVIAEVITTGAETVLMSPSSMGFNMEATPTTTIPCAVTNKSGSAGTVTVTLNVLQLEA
jgi:hypothetical protein